jgi:hypothetical protein
LRWGGIERCHAKELFQGIEGLDLESCTFNPLQDALQCAAEEPPPASGPTDWPVPEFWIADNPIVAWVTSLLW